LRHGQRHVVDRTLVAEAFGKAFEPQHNPSTRSVAPI
jgi:hypothetical protein